jgi:hypothetical protein
MMVSASYGCRRGTDTAHLTAIQTIKSAGIDVVLLSDHDAIRHGKDMFVIEFKSPSNGHLVDVGTVSVTANMPMPGMAMFGTIQVQRTDVPGRYAARSDFGMAGTWRMAVEWDGSGGHGSVTFSGTVE